MSEKKVIPLRKDAEPTVENDMCGRCHMQVARFAPQVLASDGRYHRECYEAWYFGRYGRRPSLLAGVNGDRHRFQVRERAAA
ncbi:MAG TPA: hypothetical protein VEA38_12090 [Terriglobales bacterium]|nr:hypothetical protein [Terriglobales bacterium]